MKKLSLLLVGLVTSAFAPAPAGAAIVATLQPTSSTLINEGDFVSFQTTVSVTSGLEHLAGGSASYNPGGPGTFLGPSGFGIPHDGPSITLGSSAYRYYDQGAFTLAVNGGSATHNQFHQVVFNGGFFSSRAITVFNVAPTITSTLADLSVDTNDIFNFGAAATDPGILDVLVFDWDLDGDLQYDDFTGASGSHSFSLAGSHLVGLRVSDGDGGFDFGQFSVHARDPIAAVPEPTSCLAFAGLGLCLAATACRRKRATTVAPRFA